MFRGNFFSGPTEVDGDYVEASPVLSFAIATGIDMDVISDVLSQPLTPARIAELSSTAFAHVDVRKIDLPLHSGRPSITSAAFCARYRQGVYIVRSQSKVFAIRDGLFLNDEYPQSWECICGAWELALH